MGTLKVNFSSEEAESEARSFDPVPGGEYLVAITGVEDRECGPESKNAGKPYWAIEATIQEEGDYYGRKLWTNAMLFEGALYTTAQLLKATGNEKALQTGNIPDGDTLVSKQVVAVVQRKKDTYAMKDDPSGAVVFKNEIRGFKSPSAAKSKKGGSDSILP